MAKRPEAVTIEPLAKHHDRAAFSCGQDTLDKYLRERAGHDERKNVARVFVAQGPDPRTIAGYYTLSGYGIDVSDLPDAERKKLPRYPTIPAALIGRLAVAAPFQGSGLGAHLLLDALARVVNAGEKVASYAVVVDAIDENAASFYRKYGFIPFPSEPKRLFLPTTTAKAALRTK